MELTVLLYFRTAGLSQLRALLSMPDFYIGGDKKLPSEDYLPKQLNPINVKSLFPKQYELQGYCPVTYIDGNKT